MWSNTLLAVVAGAAIQTLHTSGALDTLTDGFFALDTAQQVSLLALVFCIIFGAVSFAQQLGGGSKASRKQSKPVDYPLEEIHNAETEKAKFQCLYPILKRELLTHLELNAMPAEAIEWVDEMLDYNVPGGKLNRGTTVVSVHRTLKGGNLTDLQVARASVLGWAIEFLQAFFLVADDVMDDSQTRRGQPCWYKLPASSNDCH